MSATTLYYLLRPYSPATNNPVSSTRLVCQLRTRSKVRFCSGPYLTVMHRSSTTESQSSSNGTRSLDVDIALLGSLLSQSSGSEECDIEGPELQKLLKRLETADGVAQGVESRLDEIIGSLDQILGGLEAKAEGHVSETVRNGRAEEFTKETNDKVVLKEGPGA